MSTNNILWAANDVPLPENIWKRFKDMGFKVSLGEEDQDILSRIEDVGPKLLVDQINGVSDTEMESFQTLHSQYPELPVVFLSKNPSIEQAVNIIKLGAADYLSANIPEDQLWTVLEGLLTFPALSKKITPSRKKNTPLSTIDPVAVDPAMKRELALARKVAPKRTTLLIQGESGTGKEIIARFVHNNSDRSNGPFIAINCAALPEALLESELFGHEKGAFTGAVSRKMGKFELANGGTLLLDEISEIALSLQAKLLRVLQEREIDRVGGQYPTPVDVRVIATTNRDLEQETREGSFRSDLYFRLNVIPLNLPPLRERPKDIIPLAKYFLKKHGELNEETPKNVSKDGEIFLGTYRWPGNVRELENLMERASILIESSSIGADDLSSMLHPGGDPENQNHAGYQVMPLREMEKKMVFQALEDQNGNRTHAAKVLGISVRTLRNKLNEYRNHLEKEGK